MGTVLCMGREVADLTARMEPVAVTIPYRAYQVSEPLTEPEFVVGSDGRQWIRYRAHVLDQVTVTRMVKPQQFAGPSYQA